jgi:hypothetical protein
MSDAIPPYVAANLKCLDLYYSQKDGCKRHKAGVGKVCVECVNDAFVRIEKLFAIGMPAHHVLRLIANENISAGKGRELILGVLFGGLTWDDLPHLNVPTVMEHTPTPHINAPLSSFCSHCGSPHGTHNAGCPAKP